MLIGVLSDSHGRVDTTARAVQALLEHGAGMLLHLGDLGSEQVIDELARGPAPRPARLVFGNCDQGLERLRRYAEAAGVACDHPSGLLEMDGRRIAYTHGHLAGALDAALRCRPDYLLHGHTHAVRDDRAGTTRVLNPGALARAARYTCLLLDPSGDVARWLEVARDSHG